jgi:hypothetical protein
MSVPLDRLYDYVHRTINSDIVIYRFYPHGSKNIECLSPLHEYEDSTFGDAMKRNFLIMHDQEPLNYDFYSLSQVTDSFVDYQTLMSKTQSKLDHVAVLIKYDPLFIKVWKEFLPKLNLRMALHPNFGVYDKVLLAHSEQQSVELDKYENNGFIGVYWWSHAMIARDWYRYAQYLSQSKKNPKDFLIYNRAWSGSREYRLKFMDSLIDYNLTDHCKTSFNPIDDQNGLSYNNHNFVQISWKPKHALENHFEKNTAKSNSSADFNWQDYESTNVEVVLETLFDDTRWHLTEKTLRPIACGQPFILASTCGSLEYLKSYGFRTFDSVWSEKYDQVQDPAERLNCIVELMHDISSWNKTEKYQRLLMAQEIAQFNKKLFFSEEFQTKIVNELETNYSLAKQELEKHCEGKLWKLFRKKLYHEYPELHYILKEQKPPGLKEKRNKSDVINLLVWLHKRNHDTVN